jgi:hypothetical protein
MDRVIDEQKRDRQTDRYIYIERERENEKEGERKISPISRNLRTYYWEQISRLNIQDLNEIIIITVPKNGNGKIKKLSTEVSNIVPTGISLPAEAFSNVS